MNTQPIDQTIEKIKGKFRDLVGLPGGDKPPYDEAMKRKNRAPDDGLTSPDAQGLPPHSGTGIQVG